VRTSWVFGTCGAMGRWRNAGTWGLCQMDQAPARRRLMIASLGFISLGLPDTLIGVAWPSVRETCHLQQRAIALLFFGAGCRYCLSSFFTGRRLNRLGIGVLLAASSALVACSTVG
jgi:fucose permease